MKRLTVIIPGYNTRIIWWMRCVNSVLAALGLSDALRESEYYVGSGDVRPLKDYLRAIGRVMGKEELIGIGGRPDDGTRYKPEWFSIDNLVRDTGYRPEMRFEESL